MSFKYFDYDLTATLQLNFKFSLGYLGISAADLYNGINYDDYKSSQYASHSGSGTITDGTNQTALTTGHAPAYPSAGYQGSFSIIEPYLRFRTYQNHYGEGYIKTNVFPIPSDFVDDIVSDPTGNYSSSLEEFTVGELIYFNHFFGWKYVRRIYYNADNVIYGDFYDRLYMYRERSGIYATGSGTVSYTGNVKMLSFAINAILNIQTYSSNVTRESSDRSPFTA